MKLIKVYVGSPSYKRVLFRYCAERQWRFRQNWKCNLDVSLSQGYWFCNVITPFLRFTKCNGKVEVGLGNHYFEIGW